MGSEYNDIWSLALLSQLLRELFPSATFSDTVSEKDFWRIPRCESSGFKRAIMLAKVKVMTMKQSKLGAARLTQGLRTLSALDEGEVGGSFESMKCNLKSIHGVVRIKSYSKQSHTETFRNVLIEACGSAVIIRECVESA